MPDNKFIIKFSGDTTQLASAVQRANDSVSGFANKVKSMGGALVAGFAVRQVAEFALSVSKLAGEAEGVRAAFQRLPESTKLMLDLKRATGGTVSELELMKRAVMSSNFGISLKALPQLLEFATVRAKQTGQSVDYLVDSIVTGIGRKSKLILDNLGISAVQLDKALGGASTSAASIGQVADAVGKIAEENLRKMGSLSDNASTKLDRVSASWENVKVAIGNAANGTGVLGAVVDAVNEKLMVAASNQLKWWEKLASFSGRDNGLAAALAMSRATQAAAEEQKKHTQVIQEADRAISTFGFNIEGISKAYKQNIYYSQILEEVTRRITEADQKKATAIENVANLTEKLNALQIDQQTLTGTALANVNREIAAIERKIKALKELGLAERAAVKAREVQSVSKSPLNQDPTQIKGDAANPQLGSFAMGGKLMQPAIEMQKKVKEATDKANKSFLEQREIMARNAEEIAGIASAIGANIGAAINGQMTLAQAVLSSTGVIIDALLKRAIAGTVANAAEKSGPPPVALAVAAAGIAAVSAIFSRLGAGGRGGGVGGVGAGGVTDSRVSDKYKMQPVQITISGELTASGNGLKLALDKENYKRGVRG